MYSAIAIIPCLSMLTINFFPAWLRLGHKFGATIQFVLRPHIRLTSESNFFSIASKELLERISVQKMLFLYYLGYLEHLGLPLPEHTKKGQAILYSTSPYTAYEWIKLLRNSYQRITWNHLKQISVHKMPFLHFLRYLEHLGLPLPEHTQKGKQFYLLHPHIRLTSESNFFSIATKELLEIT